ncbi:MAG: gluconate 2-dehydrogenase subunit 3 family protein [Thermomicrobia bacterium]|nr:gluconate 2-dehydrogenase subunit 3 family protein [Thermomicrobia bacterium]
MHEDSSDQPLAGETTVAGPQAVAAVTPREPPAVAPSVLTGEQEALLGAILNRIIPEAGDLPGAGDLGIIATIDRNLAAYPSLRRLFCDGLVEIEVESARQSHAGFTGLDGGRQDAVLATVERAFPAFFAALIDHTYRGYYMHPHVYQAIGYAHRPPQPLGHALPPFDPAMLEKQRQRAPFWRRIESDQ